MYKALREYPKLREDGRYAEYEHICLTKSVMKRLASFKADFLKCGMGGEEFAFAVEMDYPNLQRVFRGTLRPNLNSYLKAAKIFGWDLSLDVNYMYATVKYTPAELLRRFRSVYRNTGMTVQEIAARSGHSISERPNRVLQAITYGPYRTLGIYARMLQDLSDIEAYDAVPAPIVIEA